MNITQGRQPLPASSVTIALAKETLFPFHFSSEDILPWAMAKERAQTIAWSWIIKDLKECQPINKESEILLWKFLHKTLILWRTVHRLWWTNDHCSLKSNQVFKQDSFACHMIWNWFSGTKDGAQTTLVLFYQSRSWIHQFSSPSLKRFKLLMAGLHRYMPRWTLKLLLAGLHRFTPRWTLQPQKEKPLMKRDCSKRKSSEPSCTQASNYQEQSSQKNWAILVAT